MANFFYHYTSIANAYRVLDEGLHPKSRFIRLGISGLPDKAHEGAVFGLPEMLPKGWCSAQWGDHGADMGMPVLESVFHYKDGQEFILFQVQVDSAVDDIYVTDYGVHLPDDYKGNMFTDDPGTLRAKADYFNALARWDEYQRDKDNLCYDLPEVICFTKIPSERCKPIARMERHKLMNDIRAKGGYELYPKPEPRKPVDVRAILNKRRNGPK